MDKLNRIYELTLKKKDIEEELKKLQESILLQENLNNLENEKIKLTYVPASSYETLDMKKVEEKEPELFNDLKEMYSKTVSIKAYIKIKIK